VNAGVITTNNNTHSFTTVESVLAGKGAETPLSNVSGSASDPCFQKMVRQWFISLSPEDRVIALGYMDESWMTLWTRLVASTTTTAASSSLSTAAISTPFSRDSPENFLNLSQSLGGCKEGEPVTPKRTTTKSGEYRHESW
jgi:hypothetical protein